MGVAAPGILLTRRLRYFVIFLLVEAEIASRERDTDVLTMLQGSLANGGTPEIKYQEGCAYERNCLSLPGETLYIAEQPQ